MSPDAVLTRLATALLDASRSIDLRDFIKRRGGVRRVGDGVAVIDGLDDVGYEELLEFDSGALGMAYDLDATGTGAILLSGADGVTEGEGVVPAGRMPDFPVSEAALGRLIDPLGNPLDGRPPPRASRRLPLFRPAPAIVDRQGVKQSLWTGIMALDAAIPIGRGQRELIVGDRNVGKTSLALDAIAAQRRGDVACVYVAVAQPLARVLSVRDALDRAGSLDNTAIICADASSAPGLQYLAPYAGATLAEFLAENGRHALVVYDDLSKHANSYRELALLLDRPPGREAYPGDIFYIHAELLERAAPRSRDAGGGSVTALPIVETTDGDISGYIPTNLISITDGQIYLDTARFERDQRPAIDIGRSVSRIGSAAQTEAMKRASTNLRMVLARFESLEALTRVGLEMDSEMETTIRRGTVLRALLRQNRLAPRDPAEQIITLMATIEGWLDAVPPARAHDALLEILSAARARLPAVLDTLNAGTTPEGDWTAELKSLAASLAPESADAAGVKR